MKRKRRLGVGCVGEFHSIEESLYYSTVADHAGLDSSWVAEHYFYRDAIVTTTYILSHTRRIRAGTSVVSPYTRHPSLLAMTATTLNEAFPGRIALGIGASKSDWIKNKLGLNFENPLTAMSESVRILRDLLRGREIQHNGSVFQARGIVLGNPAPRVPIYLAAVGPRMLELAGAVADGVLLTAGSSPFYVRESAVPGVRKGAGGDGRKLEDLDVACLALTGVSQSSKDPKNLLRTYIARFLRKPGRAEQMLHGSLVDEVHQIMKRFKEDKKAGMNLPEQVLNEVAIAGNRQKCIERLDDYFESGVNLLLLVPIGGKRKEFSELLRHAARHHHW